MRTLASISLLCLVLAASQSASVTLLELAKPHIGEVGSASASIELPTPAEEWTSPKSTLSVWARSMDQFGTSCTSILKLESVLSLSVSNSTDVACVETTNGPDCLAIPYEKEMEMEWKHYFVELDRENDRVTLCTQVLGLEETCHDLTLSDPILPMPTSLKTVINENSENLWEGIIHDAQFFNTGMEELKELAMELRSSPHMESRFMQAGEGCNSLYPYWWDHRSRCVETCPDGYYVYSSALTGTTYDWCLKCHQNCITCQGMDKYNCNECSHGHYYFPVNDANLNITAIFDADHEGVDAVGNICVDAIDCPDGYYADHVQGYCRLCDCACGTCDGPSILGCLTCNDGYFMSNLSYMCEQQCPDGQYALYTETGLGEGFWSCDDCDAECDTCLPNSDNSASGPNNCSSCPAGKALDVYTSCTNVTPGSWTAPTPWTTPIVNVACLNTPLYGATFENVYDRQGTSYSSPTGTPYSAPSLSSTTDCTYDDIDPSIAGDPSDGYNCMDDSCGLFQYNNDGVCAWCDSSCSTTSRCTGSTTYDCGACSEYTNAFGACESCPTGMYALASGGCSYCGASCDDCSGLDLSNDYICNGSCNAGWYLSGGSCVTCAHLNCDSDGCDSGTVCTTGCETGYYDAGTASATDCTLCDSACVIQGCTGPNEADCTGCDTTMKGFDSDSNTCEDCPTDCSECYIVGECHTCANSSLYASKANTVFEGSYCVSSCPLATYGNSSTMQCEWCHSTCKECTGPLATQCTACYYDPSSKSVYLLGECLSNCPIGFYAEVDSENYCATCTMCHRACIACVGPGADDCQDPAMFDKLYGYYNSADSRTWSSSTFKDSDDTDGYQAQREIVTGVNTQYENCCADGYNSDPQSFDSLNYMYQEVMCPDDGSGVDPDWCVYTDHGSSRRLKDTTVDGYTAGEIPEYANWVSRQYWAEYNDSFPETGHDWPSSETEVADEFVPWAAPRCAGDFMLLNMCSVCDDTDNELTQFYDSSNEVGHACPPWCYRNYGTPTLGQFNAGTDLGTGDGGLPSPPPNRRLDYDPLKDTADYTELETGSEWWVALFEVSGQYAYNTSETQGYTCVKECDDGWGIWPAYDMCVPCVQGCKRCDGYPKKEYSELIETYGKNYADEIMQGYTYLGMLEYGPFMTTEMFEPTCSECYTGTAWDPETNRCASTCSAGYEMNNVLRICQVSCGIPGCLVCDGSDHFCKACYDAYSLQGGRCVCDNQNLYPSELFTSGGQQGAPCDPCPPGYIYEINITDSGFAQCVCPTGFSNNGSHDGSCQKICGNNQFADGLSCSSCDPRCGSCTSGGGYSCTSCPSHAHLVHDDYGSYCMCNNPLLHMSLASGLCEPCRENYQWNQVFEECFHMNVHAPVDLGP